MPSPREAGIETPLLHYEAVEQSQHVAACSGATASWGYPLTGTRWQRWHKEMLRHRRREKKKITK